MMIQYFPENEWQFEALIRDVLQLKYNDPSIQLFARRGQSQYGIDGASSGKNWIAYQCKFRELSRYNNKNKLASELQKQLKEDVEKLKVFDPPPKKFIFATTFENDEALQLLAQKLSNDACTIEYFSWTEIKAVIEEHRDILLSHYWPQQAPSVLGFERINQYTIDKNTINDPQQLKKLGLSYYKVNDSFNVLLKVVCNDIDVPNQTVLTDAYRRIKNIGHDDGSFWIVGNGGCGKSSIMMRLAVQSAKQGYEVFCLDLENQLQSHELRQILQSFKLAKDGRCILFIDNPAANSDMLSQLMRLGPDNCESLIIVLSERHHRLKELQEQGNNVQISLQGQAEQTHLKVSTNKTMREQVYNNLLSYIDLKDANTNELTANIESSIDSKELVFANTTYGLMAQWKIRYDFIFKFDWDDYQQRLKNAGLQKCSQGFEYIALLYLFAIRTPLSLLFDLLGLSDIEQAQFITCFDNEANEPLVINSRLDENFDNHYFARLKHEKIAEHYFVHQFDAKATATKPSQKIKQQMTLLLIDWIKKVDINNGQVESILVKLFGLKLNQKRLYQWFDGETLWAFWQSEKMQQRLANQTKLQVARYLSHSWYLVANKKTQQAIDCLLKLIGLVPDNLQARTELSKIYQQQKDWAKAEQVLLACLEIDPQGLHPRTELSKIYQQQKDWAKAEQVLNEVLLISPDDIYVRTELSKIYQQQKDWAKAEQVLLEYIKLDPQGLHPRTELSKIYQQQKDWAKAEQVLLKLLSIDSDNLQARTELSKIYQQQKDWINAERVLLEYINLDPRGLHPHTELSRVYQRQGLYEKAQHMAQRALEIKSTDSYGMIELIRCLAGQQQFDLMLEYTKVYFSQHQVKAGRDSNFVISVFLNCCQQRQLVGIASLLYKDCREYFNQRNEDLFFRIIGH